MFIAFRVSKISTLDISCIPLELDKTQYQLHLSCVCKRVWLLVEKVFAFTDIGFQLCKQLHIHFWLKTKNHQFSVFTFDFKEHIGFAFLLWEKTYLCVQTRKSAAFGRTFPSACWAQIRLSSLWWKSCLRTNEHRVSNGLLNVWIHNTYIIHISNIYPHIKKPV